MLHLIKTKFDAMAKLFLSNVHSKGSPHHRESAALQMRRREELRKLEIWQDGIQWSPLCPQGGLSVEIK